jgi:hypothetical protein
MESSLCSLEGQCNDDFSIHGRQCSFVNNNTLVAGGWCIMISTTTSIGCFVNNLNFKRILTSIFIQSFIDEYLVKG